MAPSASTAAPCSASCRSRSGRSARRLTRGTASGSALRPLLVQGEKTLLIDAGIGGKMDQKSVDIFAIDRSRNLDHSLADAGVSRDDIDIVLASHLHFDHAGGFTARDASGALVPAFPRARYVVRTAEWDDAAHPHERNRASYLEGRLRAAGRRRRARSRGGRRRHHARRARGADRRPHQAPSDRGHRVAGARRRSSPPI